MTLKNLKAEFTDRDYGWTGLGDVSHPSGASYLMGRPVAAGNLIFAALAVAGSYRYSSDSGTTWSTVDVSFSSKSYQILGFGFDGTNYLMTCEDGVIAKSSNGISGWTRVDGGSIPTDGDVHAIAYAQGVYCVAVRTVYRKTVAPQYSPEGFGVDGFRAILSIYICTDISVASPVWLARPTAPLCTPILLGTSPGVGSGGDTFEGVEDIWLMPYGGDLLYPGAGFACVIAHIDHPNTGGAVPFPYRFHGMFSVDGGTTWTKIGGTINSTRAARAYFDVFCMPTRRDICVVSRDKQSFSYAGGNWTTQTLPANKYIVAAGLHNAVFYRYVFDSVAQTYVMETNTGQLPTVMTRITPRDKFIMSLYEALMKVDNIALYKLNQANGATSLADLSGGYPAVVNDINLSEQTPQRVWDADGRVYTSQSGSGGYIVSKFDIAEDIVCVGMFVRRVAISGNNNVFGQIGASGNWRIGDGKPGSPDTFPCVSKYDRSYVYEQPLVTHTNDWLFIVVQRGEVGQSIPGGMWINGVLQTAIGGTPNFFDTTRDCKLGFFDIPGIGVNSGGNLDVEFAFARSSGMLESEIKALTDLCFNSKVLVAAKPITGVLGDPGIRPVPDQPDIMSAYLPQAGWPALSSPNVTNLAVNMKGTSIVVDTPRKTGKLAFGVKFDAYPTLLIDRCAIGVTMESSVSVPSLTPVYTVLDVDKAGTGIILNTVATGQEVSGGISFTNETVLSKHPIKVPTQWEVVMNTIPAASGSGSCGLGLARLDCVLQGNGSTGYPGTAVGTGGTLFTAGLNPDQWVSEGAAAVGVTGLNISANGEIASCRFDPTTGIFQVNRNNTGWVTVGTLPVSNGETYYPSFSVKSVSGTEKMTVRFNPSNFTHAISGGYSGLMVNPTLDPNLGNPVGCDSKSWGYRLDGKAVHFGKMTAVASGATASPLAEVYILMDFTTNQLSMMQPGVDVAPVPLFKLFDRDTNKTLKPVLSVLGVDANPALITTLLYDLPSAITSLGYSAWESNILLRGYHLICKWQQADGTLALDDFTGNLAGHQVQGNKLKASAGQFYPVVVVDTCILPAQYAEAILSAGNGVARLWVRVDTLTNAGYYMEVDVGSAGDDCRVYHYDGSSSTLLYSAYMGYTYGDVAKLSITGTGLGIVLMVNGASPVTLVDVGTVINDGQPGISLGDSSLRCPSFNCGDVL